MFKTTPGKWEWKYVILDWMLMSPSGPILCGEFLEIRNDLTGNMIEFNPDVPDAKLIAAAPELLRKLKETVAVIENQNKEKINVRIWAHQLKIAVMEAKELIERIEEK